MNQPMVIGLTGGIGCGKTAVSDLFAEQGAPVIDADIISREVVEPGQPALAEITRRFGSDSLLPDGQLDRKKLRGIVFDDPGARHDLEGILHPLIGRRMRERIGEFKTPYVILSVPLLLETSQQDTVDRILVVDCAPKQQIERICARDGASRAQAEQVLAAQCSRQTRLNAADDLIDNSSGLAALSTQVRALHLRYLQISPDNDPRYHPPSR
ncbi:MAG: dephospho-CoA kinase [Gammaproteobacteria bacterium]|nr:dephospho-CoA kinase [Gammaproteobacteria bacterium]